MTSKKPQISQSSCSIVHLYAHFYLEVFQLNLKVPLMVHVFLSQEDSMTVVACLPENLDGDLYIKVDFTFTALLKKHSRKKEC